MVVMETKNMDELRKYQGDDISLMIVEGSGKLKKADWVQSSPLEQLGQRGTICQVTESRNFPSGGHRNSNHS